MSGLQRLQEPIRGKAYDRDDRCYCGVDLSPYAAVGGEASCNVSCNGVEGEICGGISALSVYEALGSGIINA